MAIPPPPSTSTTTTTTTTSSTSTAVNATTSSEKKRVSFFRNAMKRKHNFIQFFAMSGILLLSVRSLGQKYRIHDLQQQIADLHDEQLSLSDRLSNIKAALRREDAVDSSGLFAARLNLLFAENE